MGRKSVSKTARFRPVCWIEGRSDVLIGYRIAKETTRASPLSLLNYLRSLRGRREYAYWAVDDPIPSAACAAGLPRVH